MDRWDWLLVVASVVLGQFALLGIEWLRSWLDRKQRKQDRRDDFQHNSLVELQESLVVLANAVGQIVRRVMTDEAVTLEVLEVHRQAESRYWVLLFRVTDESVQKGCKQYLASTRKVMDATIMVNPVSKDKVKASFDESGWLFNDAQKPIGERLQLL